MSGTPSFLAGGPFTGLYASITANKAARNAEGPQLARPGPARRKAGASQRSATGDASIAWVRCWSNNDARHSLGAAAYWAVNACGGIMRSRQHSRCSNAYATAAARRAHARIKTALPSHLLGLEDSEDALGSAVDAVVAGVPAQSVRHR